MGKSKRQKEVKSSLKEILTQNFIDVLYEYFDYLTCVLMAFIILLPKISFIAVPGIYFNIRVEDFLIATVYFIYILGLLARKIKWRYTPLFLPIFVFLFVAFLSTLLGIITHTVPSTLLAILYFSRYVEYLGIFFIMLTVFRKERLSNYLKIVVFIYLGVLIYGILAKLSLVPMFRTRRSGGVPVYYNVNTKFLQSTFGGHYDFGAYLLINLPILLSLLVTVKRKSYQIILGMMLIATGYMLYGSFARSSMFAIWIALLAWLLFRKSKLFFVPILGEISVIWSYISGRFSKYSYKFSLKISDNLWNKIFPSKEQATSPTQIATEEGVTVQSTPSASISQVGNGNGKNVTPVKEKNTVDLGEDIDISLDASAKLRFYRWRDLLNRFKEHPLFGNGPSSVGPGADGDYIRWLSELGIIGTLAFLFLLWKIFRLELDLYKKVSNPLAKYFFLALISALIGLLANALFIDVFESSKIAFYFWFLTGMAAGYYCVSFSKLSSVVVGKKDKG